MTTTVTMTAFPIEYRDAITRCWMGKRDADGNPINEDTYRVKAYLFDREIACSDYGRTFMTRAAALRDCKAEVRRLINLHK